MKKSLKEINRQLNKEALLTLGLFLLFFLWWYATAYGLKDAAWTVFGLPAWFFMSCVVGWLLCCVGVALLVKTCFKDVDLDAFAEDAPEDEAKAAEVETVETVEIEAEANEEVR